MDSLLCGLGDSAVIGHTRCVLNFYGALREGGVIVLLDHVKNVTGAYVRHLLLSERTAGHVGLVNVLAQIPELRVATQILVPKKQAHFACTKALSLFRGERLSRDHGFGPYTLVVRRSETEGVVTIAKVIQRPTNWQDFERLCKKLFGEMFGCSATIKSNGRSGQTQDGVDIYGVAKDASGYFGVQCKAGDEDRSADKSIESLDEEIRRAQKFKPALVDFIFATTAKKDVTLEQYARERDLASRAAGSFSITLYCWEDLADLIDENRETYRWWVLEKRHKSRFAVDVVMNAGDGEVLRPKFRRVTTLRELRGNRSPGYRFPDLSMLSRFAERNLSFVDLFVEVRNTGQEVLEEFRVDFALRGDGHRISDGINPMFFNAAVPRSLGVSETTFEYTPHDRRPLTQEDSCRFRVRLRPDPNVRLVEIDWKLFARDFATSGTTQIAVEAEFEEAQVVQFVDSVAEVGETLSIDDLITKHEG